jgi:predicted Zn-dependent protease
MLGLLAGVAFAPALAGCDGEGGFPVSLVSDADIRRLGLETWEQMRRSTPVSRDGDLQQALDTVGSRLLDAAGEDPRNWEMVVFASPDANAFALPGGKIGVFEGMFRAAANADQLAAVVGHEIGHIQAEHAQERVSASIAKEWGLKLVRALLNLGDVPFSAEVAALMGLGVEFGLALPYSRRQELEADRLGLFTMARARFEPGEAVGLWRRMEQASRGGVPAFLTTHPAPDDRIEAIEALLPEVERAVQGA